MNCCLTRGRAVVFRLALLAAALVLLSGCVRAEIGVRVEDDGSGTATMLFAFKQSLLDFMASLDEDGTGNDFKPEDVFNDVDRSQLPEGTKVEPYRADGFVGSRITIPFKDVSELSGLLGLVTNGVSTPTDATQDSGGFERFAIERTEDGWRLEAVAAPLTTEEDVESADDDFAKQFLQDASFTIRVRLPGRIGQHNADAVSGNELSWDLDFESTQPRELRAQSAGSDGSDGVPWMLIGGAAAGLAALGGVAWDVRRRARAGTA